MSSKKKAGSKAKVSKIKKIKEHKDLHIPGFLLIAYGILGLAVNFDLIESLTWAKAYPLLGVLFGFAFLAKVILDE